MRYMEGIAAHSRAFLQAEGLCGVGASLRASFGAGANLQAGEGAAENVLGYGHPVIKGHRKKSLGCVLTE